MILQYLQHNSSEIITILDSPTCPLSVREVTQFCITAGSKQEKLDHLAHMCNIVKYCFVFHILCLERRLYRLVQLMILHFKIIICTWYSNWNIHTETTSNGAAQSIERGGLHVYAAMPIAIFPVGITTTTFPINWKADEEEGKQSLKQWGEILSKICIRKPELSDKCQSKISAKVTKTV